MARGDIHLETGTTCKAQSDETCPYGGGHVESLEAYASYHGADPKTLRGLVENARMAPKAALELMGSGEMKDSPDPLTKSSSMGISQRQQELADRLGPIPAQQPVETAEQRYEREMTEYKIAMVKYENQQIANYSAAVAAANASPFAPRPTPPPLRTVYPKSFEAYDQQPKDFLPEELPREIADQPGGEALWQEYLRKRKQLGDGRHIRGDQPDRILYL